LTPRPSATRLAIPWRRAATFSRVVSIDPGDRGARSGAQGAPMPREARRTRAPRGLRLTRELAGGLSAMLSWLRIHHRPAAKMPPSSVLDLPSMLVTVGSSPLPRPPAPILAVRTP
jgi:hypothetical protein